MKLKKLIAVATTVVMSLSLLAGFSAGPESEAKTTSYLPEKTGLYVCPWFDWENGKVITDTDQYGNTVAVNREGEAHEYKGRDGWYFDEVSREDGPRFDPIGALWFDYVDGTKVTHVPFSKLKFTNIDGSECESFSAAEDGDDSRAVSYSAMDPCKVLVTYKDGKTNNQMIMDVRLPEMGFYDSETPSFESWYSNESNEFLLKGSKKTIYYIMSDSEDRAFSFDPTKDMKVMYCDDGQDVMLDGSEVSKLVKVTPVDVAKANYNVYKLEVSAPDGNTDNWLSIEINSVRSVPQ